MRLLETLTFHQNEQVFFAFRYILKEMEMFIGQRGNQSKGMEKQNGKQKFTVLTKLIFLMKSMFTTDQHYAVESITFHLVLLYHITYLHLLRVKLPMLDIKSQVKFSKKQL